MIIWVPKLAKRINNSLGNETERENMDAPANYNLKNHMYQLGYKDLK